MASMDSVSANSPSQWKVKGFWTGDRARRADANEPTWILIGGEM